MVLLVGGPEAGEVYAGLRPDNQGFLVFQGTFRQPDAWYKINYDADPAPTEYGPAQPANYLGKHPPARS